MTPRGPSPLGGDPDDGDGAPSDEGRLDDLRSGGADDGGLKGWVPPEQRVWRHPSEALGPGPSKPGAPGPVTVRPLRHRPHLTALVASGAVVAVVAGVLLLMNAGPMGTSDLSGSPSTTTAAFTNSSDNEPAAATRTARSLVALTMATAHGTQHGVAVAVAAGGLLATTADGVAGATEVTAMTVDGRHERASVVAVDSASDIALLQVPNPLPVPHFVPDSAISTGRTAMVLALASPAGPEPVKSAVAAWSFGTVNSVGTVVVPGPGPGMDAVGARAVGAPELPGEVLADSSGDVLGIYAHTAAGGDQLFIPTDLLLGVSADLAQTGRVTHGWLDVDGADVPAQSSPASGALVAGVAPAGPSADQLQTGDVIVAVDGQPVRSMAELRARLYVLAAGAPATVEVVRHDARTSVTIRLAPSP